MAAISTSQRRQELRHGAKANQVIHGVNAEIADGEFVVIVGPSGCGKSTLLRMVAGLEEITGGEIAIGGRVVNDLEPKDRDIAMVFQNYALYPHMSVFDNMAYGLKIAQGAEATRSRRASTRRPRSSSSAHAARAQAARALRRPAPARRDGPRDRARAGRCSCSTSRCPTSTPSCACRRGSRSRSCTASCGTTSLFVTHDQVEAMTLGAAHDRDERRPHGADRHARRGLRTARPPPSSPASSARRR